MYRISGKAELSDVTSHSRGYGSISPILICLLGEFRVLKRGQPVSLHGGKARTLLHHLALQYDQPVQRDQLLEIVWPGHAPDLARQSLNSLTHGLHRSLGDEIGNNRPVLHEDGYYRLNLEGGVGVDIAYFEMLVAEGEKLALANSQPAAIALYERAAQLYRGDLYAGTDITSVMTRERLRAHFLTVLARLADYYFATADYGRSLHYTHLLLEYDACREDAHRMVMCCHVRLGERAQALRQYNLCVQLLRAEFDAEPEAQTTLLYNQLRLAPDTV